MIHARAEVDGTAHVAPRACVWQFASVIRHATVGEDSCIGGCAVVDAADVGERCRIGHGAQLHPGTFIEDDVFVGPGAICGNDRWPRAAKEGFDAEALLDGRMTMVRIERGASIGAGAVILPGAVIGRDAMVAAGAVVNRSVPSAHLFKRSGEIVPIDPARVRRICEAAA